jgi:hypothetical protein
MLYVATLSVLIIGMKCALIEPYQTDVRFLTSSFLDGFL